MLGKALRRTLLAAALSVLCCHAVLAQTGAILTIDRLVDHVSTVPAIAGKHIDLFVRERASAKMVKAGKARPGTVVLFVHGGYSPSTLAFDVQFEDYSWMEYLARAGYDVFGMDMTGYGRSGHPMMDDPCNLDPKQQDLLIPRNMAEKCQPHSKSKAELLADIEAFHRGQLKPKFTPEQIVMNDASELGSGERR